MKPSPESNAVSSLYTHLPTCIGEAQEVRGRHVVSTPSVPELDGMSQWHNIVVAS
jgi:hypothetical protein